MPPTEILRFTLIGEFFNSDSNDLTTGKRSIYLIMHCLQKSLSRFNLFSLKFNNYSTQYVILDS